MQFRFQRGEVGLRRDAVHCAFLRLRGDFRGVYLLVGLAGIYGELVCRERFKSAES